MMIIVGIGSAVVAAVVVYAVMAARSAAIAATLKAAAQERERELAAQERRIVEQERHYRELMAQTEVRFRDLAQKVLEERSAKLKAEGTEGIRQTLDPLRIQIAQFKDDVRKANEAAIQRNASLDGTIKALLEKTGDVTKEAERLSKAIEADAQVTGQWGETQLKTLLESAGADETVGFTYQQVFDTQDDEGRPKKVRADFIVALPNGRKLVIDAKTTMASYVEYANCDPQDEACLRDRIVASVKAHVDELRELKYQKAVKNSFDYVIMYIPFEEVYMLAMKAYVEDSSGRILLRDYARKHHIVIANVSSLLPVIHAVKLMWAGVDSDKKAERIIEDCNRLCWKFGTFLEKYRAVGVSLAGAVHSFNEATKPLCTGSGNFVDKLRDLAERGVLKAETLPSGETYAEKCPVVAEPTAIAGADLN